MVMNMKFDLAKFLNDLKVQFNDQEALEAFRVASHEALKRFKISIVSNETMDAVISAMRGLIQQFHNDGKLHAPEGINFDSLDKNHKMYMDWVGTTVENVARPAVVNPEEMFRVVYNGVLRYFQMQFDAGGWNIENDSKTSRIYIHMPREEWTLDIAFNRKDKVNVV